MTYGWFVGRKAWHPRGLWKLGRRQLGEFRIARVHQGPKPATSTSAVSFGACEAAMAVGVTGTTVASVTSGAVKGGATAAAATGYSVASRICR
jgi:hypothetical protein